MLDKIRQELNDLVAMNLDNLTNPVLVEKSQEMDLALNNYERERKEIH